MGSLTVHVLDSDDTPVSGIRVHCNFVGSHVLGLADSHSEAYTDDDGFAEFDDVPIGRYRYTSMENNKSQSGFGQNDHEDVTVTI